MRVRSIVAKIKGLTISYEPETKEEEAGFLALLKLPRSVDDKQHDKGVEKEGNKDYSPTGRRQLEALRALTNCKRLRISRNEILEVWAGAFPDVDLANEIRKCEAWAHSKDVTRSPRGWQRALNYWLSRAQDNIKKSSGQQAVQNPDAIKAIRDNIRSW